MDITTVPAAELAADRQASLDDIEHCRLALKLGILESGGVKHFDRIRDNQAIIKRIDIELKRRGMVENDREGRG